MKNKLLLCSIFITASLFGNDHCLKYEIEGSLLFLQPNSSNLYYGAEAKPFPVPTPNWKSLEIRPDYHAGFEVGLTASYEGSCTFFNVSWERLHSSDSSSKTVPEADMLGPYFNIGPDAQPYKIARGHVEHQFDSIDLTLARQCHYGRCLCLNYYAGAAFTRIKQTMSSYFSNKEGTITRDIQSPSLYWGVGPIIGAELNYLICDKFTFVNRTSLSLLIGTIENSTTYLSTTPLLDELNITPPNKQTTKVPDRNQVIPGISEKMGFAYATCCRGYLLSMEIGYRVEAYFNAIQSVDMSSEVSTPPEDTQVGVYALGFQRTLSNFLLSGPYLALTVQF